MPIKCPICQNNLPRGKTVSFQDLARITIKIHECKHCNARVMTNADTQEILKVNGKKYEDTQ